MIRLHHEALVGYRVLAQEPQLGVLYIVSEFIDGVNLSDALGKIKPSEDELAGLLKRLASGLAAAHRLGAVHRDISPDNILLEGGDYHKAKVIDFGIAKDTDPNAKTIVGEGFAGKLNYVAPEQLGDFGREVGPWTDVYSLALVILAVILGKNVRMGGSLVDAVDKRRAGVDLSPVPEKLKPVLERMLVPDPKQRIRSMDDVVAMLDGAGMGNRPPEVIIEQRGPSKGVLIGGALAVLALAGGGAWFAMNAGPSTEEQVQIARTAVEQALPNVECSWLNIVGVQAGEPLSVRMTGVAGNPTGARNQITQAITAAGIEAANVSVEEVALIQPAGCSALQTYGKIRSNAAPAMSVAQREFETMRQSDGPTVARAKVQLNPPQGKDMALFGIEPKGLFSDMLSSRTALNEAVAAGNPKQIAPGVYEVTMDLDHTGWSGLILLTGDGPFDGTLTQPDVNARGPDWQSNFVATASEREWKAEMLWFKSVDKQPN